MDDIFKGRTDELLQAAAYGGCFVFTDFLNEAELSYVKSREKYYGCEVSFFGGYDGAQRVMARFGPEREPGGRAPFPIAVIRVSPLNLKFSEKLSHRDFLGAVLNLGIDRRLTGDILTDGTEGWIFVREHIASFAEENLTRVKHTPVKAQRAKEIPEGIIRAPEEIIIITPSLRLDAVVSKVFNLSRKDAGRLFAAEKIYVNNIVQTKSSYILKPGDLVSVRGSGRLRYMETFGATKKGNIKILVQKY